eukprot:CAMPEP_0205943572 /NCGR_PEP_ID=MMETSP1325-20131115/60843_2 /ASSEMBLY_ACC=CAM_ASM_000708 /TAXON_ID=236786 /ORGANISM="Florenciella sp., Strain RCC1007" /LENGTH=183 /DNA_ID=CAMNT_0053314399 /DNA_START=717 /DNA_END=1265 /DNA_ORIENTATION=-
MAAVLVIIVVRVAIVEAFVVAVPVGVCVAHRIAPVLRIRPVPKLLSLLGPVRPDPVALGLCVRCTNPTDECEAVAHTFGRDESLDESLLLCRSDGDKVPPEPIVAPRRRVELRLLEVDTVAPRRHHDVVRCWHPLVVVPIELNGIRRASEHPNIIEAREVRLSGIDLGRERADLRRLSVHLLV